MIYTFNVKHGMMVVGRTVWSDFGSHLPLIRSFSRGANFPTQFQLFPDGDMRYHFMFQFLVGNLEYLGLRIDWAFNIPSILALVGAMMALYALAVSLTGKKSAGVITGLLFWFRSSFAFFTFVRDIDSVGQIFTNNAFIGNTMNEAWGLWNQNVYANQRHLAFGLILLFAVIIEVLPLLKGKFWQVWVRKEAWAIESWRRCLGIGLLIGSLAYWNGAVVIAVLMILAFMAVFSERKLEFMVIAGLTYGLTIWQSNFFVPSGESLVDFSWRIGFLSESEEFMGIVRYYIELMGILPFLAILSIFIVKGFEKKWLVLTFFVPIVFATTVSLTPDIAVNHKYIMMAAMLLNIFVAQVIVMIYERRNIAMKAMAVILVALLTVTGMVDFITIVNANTARHSVFVDDRTPEIVWVMENTEPRDIILIKEHSMNDIVNAGRPIFHGWPYFAWSAGYDTYGRDRVAYEIFGARDIGMLRRLLKENNIAYVIICDEVRYSENYTIDEYLFSRYFERVAEFGTRDIYKVGLQ
jgi:hypothetical protein